MKSSQQLLAEEIALLKIKQLAQLNIIKAQFHSTYESLKPINYLKSLLSDVIKSPDFKKDILQTVLGLVSGYLTKKIVIGDNASPLKKVLGIVLQFISTRFVANKSENVVDTSMDFVTNFFASKKTPDLDDLV